MALPDHAYPGLTLGSTAKYAAGLGTYIHGHSVCASLTGHVSVEPSVDQKLQLLSVTFPGHSLRGSAVSRAATTGNTLPAVNSIVLAKVTRLQACQANFAIIIVDGATCADAFPGVVRKEDVRGWEIDKVVIGDAFRVGDIVRAVVISIGDQSSYYLSTARNELGVLLATSEASNQMYPVSWKEFKDPETGKKEARKVAKPN